MRVHDLAKQLEISSKELLAELQSLGSDAKSHMSVLDEAVVKLVRARRVKAPAKKPPAARAAAVAEAARPKAEAKPKAEPKPKVQPKPKLESRPKAMPKVEPKAKPEAKPEPAAPVKPPAPPAKPAVPPAKLAAKPAPPAHAEPPAKPTTAPEKALKAPAPAQPDSKVIVARGAIVVRDLAQRLGLRPNQLIAELMGMNILANLNEVLDVRVARKIAEKHGFTIEHEKKIEEHKQVRIQRITDAEAEVRDRPEDLVPKPPVVTFMGHVDHGKTSLLDKIRHTRVAAGESGGITQHIGAYVADVNGAKITFMDTPGHAAFTAMRARGAELTDIAVIVIAADDGVMPQTKEAISHVQAAEVTMMVAINKIDLPGANVDLVKRQLQAMNLSPEEWGGDLICCAVSAQTGEGIDHLLEMILLQAEMLELKANPKRSASGYVIEAKLEAGMGPTATLLVGNGTLLVGDGVLCGACYGKVKALIDDRGARVKSAGPGTAVKCLGLSSVPEAGQSFKVCLDERAAREVAQGAMEKQRTDQVVVQKKASLETLFEHLKESEKKELRVILKADAQGSVEAITQSLEEIKSDKVSLNIILKGTGNVTTNDVMLAAASDAVILGFYVPKEPGVDTVAKHEGVEIRLHRIIYELIDEVRDAMTGLLAPKFEERLRGRAEIKQVFPIGKRVKVAGCMVMEGYVTPKLRVRVKRKSEVLHEGTIASLKRFQDDAAQVKETQECGIRLEGYTDFAEGDILEFYELEEVKQTL